LTLRAFRDDALFFSKTESTVRGLEKLQGEPGFPRSWLPEADRRSLLRTEFRLTVRLKD
jgi:hypothetical protein